MTPDGDSDFNSAAYSHSQVGQCTGLALRRIHARVCNGHLVGVAKATGTLCFDESHAFGQVLANRLIC